MVVLKELHKKGFDQTVLDKASGVGGAFHVAYEHMFLTISSKLMEYSDFAWTGRPRYAPVHSTWSTWSTTSLSSSLKRASFSIRM